MSVIFPGNYVAHLNAYRDQGVFALPGIEFYQLRGAAVVEDTVAASAGLTPLILSPDLRQDDKPRLDKPFVVPEGAVVYRSAITAVNLATTGTGTVAVDGISTAAVEASLAAVAGVFPEEGAATDFLFTTTLTPEGSDVNITIANSSELTIVDPGDQAAVLVEVCYFIPGEAPTTDDLHLPYKVEAGQGY